MKLSLLTPLLIITVILRQTTFSDMTSHSHALIDSDSPAQILK